MICYIACYITCYILTEHPCYIVYYIACYITYYILNHETHAALTHGICKIFENLFCLGSSSTTTATAASSPRPALDDLDCRDLEDYGIDPDGPDPKPDGNEMDLALAALFKGIPGISAEDLDGLLKDLPVPQAGASAGISVQEAVEVRISCYITCYITCYIIYTCSLECCRSWTPSHLVSSLPASASCKILLRLSTLTLLSSRISSTKFCITQTLILLL